MRARADLSLIHDISGHLVAGGRRERAPCSSFCNVQRITFRQEHLCARSGCRISSRNLSKTFPAKEAVVKSSTEDANGMSAVQSRQDERQAHNECQSQYLDSNCDIFPDEFSEDVKNKATSIVGLADVRPESTVLICGVAGAGPLLPALQAVGVKSIVVADVSIAALSLFKERFDSVACWYGDIVDLPSSFAAFRSIFFADSYSSVYSQATAMRAAASLVEAGGTIVISQLHGQAAVKSQHAANPQVFPHTLPDKETFLQLLQGLPVKLSSLRNDLDLYVAIFNVGEPLPRADHGSSSEANDAALAGAYFFPQAPLYLRGKVVTGFGRGSKKMGVPTANLPPEDLVEELQGVANGVYFGWAQVVAEGFDAGVQKMVMNIGKRPTFVDGEGITVEVHILHDYGADFYGQEVRALALGFVREERKFSSIDELVGRIRADMEISRNGLDEPGMQLYKADSFFS